MHIYAKQKNCKLKQKSAEASSKLNVGTSIRLRNILASNGWCGGSKGAGGEFLQTFN